MSAPKNEQPHKASVLDVFITFLKLGLTSFGGPVAHMGYFRQTLVHKKKWVSESHFSQLLAICQFLPGPASSQLGFVLGLHRAGWLGALFAFLAFTLPSVFILIFFASSLPYLSSEASIAAIHGLKLVACAVVADAVLGMYKNLCPDWPRRIIALCTLLALLFVDGIGFTLCVLMGGALLGRMLCRHKAPLSQDSVHIPYSKKVGGALIVTFALLLVFLPFFADQGILYRIAHTFYQAGALVFGGGHVVLPLLESTIVGGGLVTQENFLTGYGASQAIPGPMFSFAAYLGSLISSEYSQLFLGLFSLFFMFLPGFLLVAGVLPFWQRLPQYPNTVYFIAGLNAAVVGLLAAALYDPILSSGLTSLTDIAIVVIALVMLIKGKISPLWVVLWCVLASIVMLYV